MVGVVEPARSGAHPTPALDRRFEAVVFDWDGTAVPDREADASALRELVEELCALGLDLAVISGTPTSGTSTASCAPVRPGPGRLHFLVNRGSEVFRASSQGLDLLYRREATGDENAALDQAAAATVAALALRGVHAEIVSERLNRRKIDVIPELGRSAEGVDRRASGRRREAAPRRRPVRPPRGSRPCDRRCLRSGRFRPARHERREAPRDRPDRQVGLCALGLRPSLAARHRPGAGADRGRRVRGAR